jgi:hypothetical protein
MRSVVFVIITAFLQKYFISEKSALLDLRSAVKEQRN